MSGLALLLDGGAPQVSISLPLCTANTHETQADSQKRFSIDIVDSGKVGYRPQNVRNHHVTSIVQIIIANLMERAC